MSAHAYSEDQLFAELGWVTLSASDEVKGKVFMLKLGRIICR